MGEEVINIQDIVFTLKKRWKLIFILTMIVTTISVIINFFIILPEYEARTKVFIGKEGSITKGTDKNYNDNDVEMYQKLLKTYAEIIQTDDLIGKAINGESLGEKSKDVLKNLTVTPTKDTQILEIKYTNKDRILAKDVLYSIINEFIIESKQIIPNGNVKVIESVKTPEEPISPNKPLNIAATFFLGLMISVGLSFFLEFIDNTFKKKEQLEETLGVPVIGVIPYFPSK